LKKFKGTSAVSALYAALTARLMNLYSIARVQNDFQNGGYYRTLAFRDVTTGNNGYSASVGWDPVTGMGSFANYTPSTNIITTTTKSPFTPVSSTMSNFSFLLRIFE
jgi:hypothetical protein